MTRSATGVVARGSGLLMLQTYYVAPRKTEPFYELHLAPDAGRDAARTVLVTRDEALYDLALSLEGSDARINVEFRRGRTVTGRLCSILLSLQICPVAVAAR